MSIDFEVAGENWKVAGKLMQTTQPSAPPSLLVALYGRESGGHWRRPFFTTGTFDYIVAVIQALQFVDYKNVLRFYFFNAQLTNYKCSLIQYGDENDSEVLVVCLIRVLLYRRNVYNFVKRHLELIAIFLKKIRKKTRICNPDNSIPLRLLYDFISDERKITTDIIRVRGYVAMFICKDLQIYVNMLISRYTYCTLYCWY
jgi:hypothetical protein